MDTIEAGRLKYIESCEARGAKPEVATRGADKWADAMQRRQDHRKGSRKAR